MNKPGSISPSGVFQGFQLLRQASMLLISVILAKSMLSAEAIGVYEQLFFLQYAVSFFWVSGLIQALLSLYPQLDKDSQTSFLSSAYMVLTSISLLLTLGMLMGSQPLLQFLTGQPRLPFYPLFLFQQLLHLPTFLLEYLFLLQGRGRAIAAFGLLSFGGALAVVGVAVGIGGGIQEILWGFTVLGIVKHIWLVLEIIRLRPAQVQRWPLIHNWMALAAPLVAYAFLGGLIQTYGGWAVNRHFSGDSTQFALFRYGAREFPLIIALSEALNAALIPLVAGRGQEVLGEIRNKTLRLMHLVFPLTIALVVSSKYWFPFVFSPAFEASIPVLNAFFMVAISRVVFPRAILIGLQDNRAVLAFSILELLLLAVATALLLPGWGIQGVAIATAIAFWAEKGLQILRLYTRFGIAPDSYIPLGWWAAYSAILLGAYLSTL